MDLGHETKSNIPEDAPNVPPHKINIKCTEVIVFLNRKYEGTTWAKKIKKKRIPKAPPVPRAEKAVET